MSNVGEQVQFFRVAVPTHLHNAAILVLVAACAAFGLASAFTGLHAKWADSFTYSHGYLVLAMALWLIWRDRLTLNAVAASPSVAGLGLLVLAMMGYLLADILDFALGRLILLPVLGFAVASALWGLPLGLRIAPAVAFLYFAIPVWDVFIRPLQEITTAVVSGALHFTPVTAFIQGNYIATPNGNFEVAEGCSGVHFFIVATAIAAYYGIMWLGRWPRSVLLVAVAAAAAMVANWLRVLTLILVGDYTSMEHYLIQEDHYTFGWVVFAVMMLPVLWLARRLEEPNANAPGTGLKVNPHAPGSSGKVLFATFVCGGVLLMPVLANPAPAAPPEQAEMLQLEQVITAGASEWRAVALAEEWQPHYHQPWAMYRGAYGGQDPIQVDLYAARYDQQQAGSKLIYYGNKLTAGFQTVSTATQNLAGADRVRTVRETRLARVDAERLIWEWYRVGEYASHRRIMAKLLEVAALLDGRRDAAVIAASARCVPDCDSARQAMEDLLTANLAELETTVMNVRRD